ncbi:hypothetical protein AB0886_05190 [Streptomyces sp. NPDC024062]|uniref:hypothetical protein n=1 Tax=unclassified Streptomyces TaxID=2593676 RepID=UPI00341CD7E1
MPYVPQDVLDRLSSLEREVRQLRGRAQIRPALNQVLNGDVQIGEGGQLIVVSPGVPDAIFAVGKWTNTQPPTYGTAIRREDGSHALLVGGETGTGGNQMIRILSRADTVIMMDDAFADGYLGRPYVPVPMTPAATVTSDTDTPLYSGHLVVQHKVLKINGQILAPAGTSIRARLTIDGDEIGAWTLNSTATAMEINQRIALSATDHPHSSDAVVVMWAQRTGGTGTGTVRVRGVWGMNTATAEEAN